MSLARPRHFLFLQGPHGPFFDRLARMLRRAETRCTRIGFNAGDAAFWRDRDSYIPFDAPATEWPDFVAARLDDLAITDLVIYGDTRPIHAQAIIAATARGITVHVFEEGYLRPYWVTYERGGANGHSRLMELSVARMRSALSAADHAMPEPPAHWGDMRQHVAYGALYHWFVLFRNGRYRHFQPHRPRPLLRETLDYTARLFLMPAHAVQRALATAQIRRGGYPYHLALLQLDHDANFRSHSPFPDNAAFIRTVIDGFARGAPGHHHLVFKAHPLEPGRAVLRRAIARAAQDAGIAKRVHFVRGGKLAQVLDHARTAVTVNSTAAQQVLWRGIPLRIFGDAVYDKPEFVSRAPLADFFAQPSRPDLKAYHIYRHYLLESSQVTGGFYSRRGRRQLLRQIVDMMLAPHDPYEALDAGTALPRHHLRLLP
ncbi:MAG: capsule biosynthesis protein CapA [Rhodobacterales bacterium]|nr:MAG: capsule biosynthesis protein CapA [Rhodobacterales bacterium]